MVKLLAKNISEAAKILAEDIDRRLAKSIMEGKEESDVLGDKGNRQ